jgi:phosphatidylglycerophosphatase A
MVNNVTSPPTQKKGGGWVVFLSSGAYLGYMRFAPGTWGTLPGIPLYLLLSRLPLWAYLVALILIMIASVYIAERAEAYYGTHDDKRIVIDETAGYLVTMTGVNPGWTVVILGFILFRFFDITKPWPCSAIDRGLPGGLGTTLDDAAAGLFGVFVLHLSIYLWPNLGTTNW